MKKNSVLTIQAGTQKYHQKLIKQFNDDLILILPLMDKSGVVAFDKSGNAFNGSYINNIELNSVVSSSGLPSPKFIAGQVNLYSVALQTVFPFTEGALGIWFKPLSSDVWTDGVSRYVFYIATNAQNRILARTNVAGNRLDVMYIANNVIKNISLLNIESTDWQRIWLSWSLTGDNVSLYLNGKIAGSLDTVGTWQGTTISEDSLVIGSVSNTNTVSGWSGYSSDYILINRPITAGEVLIDYEFARGYKRKTLSIIGDSISNDSNEYPYLVARIYNKNALDIVNHAVGGHTIIDNMDGQVVAAATDDADIIIIALGTNDNNAGNMTTLQAEYEENIAELKVSNPRATIYSMNVLPRWTDVGGSTEVDKSNIRTAITAACTAQSITCWDTYTDPWIVVTDTVEGIHPTTTAITGGQAKIALKVLERLT